MEEDAKVRQKNSQMSGSEQALEVALIDVENAAEVIRLGYSC
jgi:hypothetical protein